MTAFLTLEQLCYTSLPRKGWTTFGASKGLVASSLIEEHCRYHDVWPARITETAPIVDYGFRMLGSERGCFYRTQRPAGKDEFQREVHLVHNLVISTADLDAIDYDIPALFAWALRNNAFYETREAAMNACQAHPEGLPQVSVDLDEIRTWSRDNAADSPSNRLMTWPDDVRRDVARTALQLALVPQDEAIVRPTIWVASGDGRTQSREEFEIIEFLYMVLPRAWRMKMSFSTFRPLRALEGFRWMSTCLDDQQFSDDQRRHRFYVANWRREQSLRDLPAVKHRWIDTIVNCFDEPWNESQPGRAAALANGLECLSEAELVSPSGFLDRALACSRILDGDGQDFAKALEHLKTAQPNRTEPLDRLLEAVVGLNENRLKMNLSDILRRLIKLLSQQSPEELKDAERIESVIEVLERVIRHSLENADAWEHATKLLRLLKNSRFEPVRNRIVPGLIAFIEEHQDQEEPNRRRTLLDMVTFLGPWFLEYPTEHPERRAFGDCARQQILRSAKLLSEEQIKDAEEVLYPYLETHDPRSDRDVFDVLSLLLYVQRNGGPDLRRQYLVQACQNCSDLRRLDPLFGPQAEFLLCDLQVWRDSAAELPDAVADQLRNLSRSELVATWWKSTARFRSQAPTRYFEHLVDVIRACDDDDAFALEKEYAEAAETVLIQLLDDQAERSTQRYDAHLALLKQMGRLTDASDVTQTMLRKHVAALLAGAELNTLLVPIDEAAAETQLKEVLSQVCQMLERWRWTVAERWDLFCLVGEWLAERTHSLATFADNSVGIWQATFGAKDGLEGICAAQCVREGVRLRVKASHFDEQNVIVTLLVQHRQRIGNSNPESEFGGLLLSHLEESVDIKRGVIKCVINLLQEECGKHAHTWLAAKSPGWSILSQSLPQRLWPDFLDRLAVRNERGTARHDVVDQWRTLANLYEAADGLPIRDELRVRLERAFEFYLRLEEKPRIPPVIWRELPIAVSVAGRNVVPYLVQLLRLKLEGGISEHQKANLETLSLAVDAYQRDPASIFRELKDDTCFALAFAACKSNPSRPAKIIDHLRRREKNDQAIHDYLTTRLLTLGNTKIAPPYDLLRNRIRLAACLWSDNKDDFGHFLAHFGDGKVSAHGKSPPHKQGIEITAVAVATYLTNPYAEEQADWDSRLNAVRQAWQKPKDERISKRKHWKQFENYLRAELKDSDIPVDTVLEELRPLTVVEKVRGVVFRPGKRKRQAARTEQKVAANGAQVGGAIEAENSVVSTDQTAKANSTPESDSVSAADAVSEGARTLDADGVKDVVDAAPSAVDEVTEAARDDELDSSREYFEKKAAAPTGEETVEDDASVLGDDVLTDEKGA